MFAAVQGKYEGVQCAWKDNKKDEEMTAKRSKENNSIPYTKEKGKHY